MPKRLLIYILLLGGIEVQAQYLKYSNDFLSIGIGARAAGMGNSVIAGAKDVTSGYWNPASLMLVEDKIQIGAMHNEQFAGIVKHDYAAISYKPDDKQIFALSLIRMGVDDIPNTLNLFQNGQIDYSKLTSFSAVDYAVIGSVARSTAIKGLNIGANVKVIRRVIGEFAGAWGFGFDVGAQYQWRKYKTAVVIRDVTTTFNAWSYHFTEAQKQILLQTNNSLPNQNLELTAPTTSLGVARTFMVWQNKLSILPELNADITIDGKRNVLISSSFISIDPRIGLELGYKEMIYLRGGMNRFQREYDLNGIQSTTFMPSAGVGIKIGNLAIDYAIANPGSSSSLPHSNIVSLHLGINRG